MMEDVKEDVMDYLRKLLFTIEYYEFATEGTHSLMALRLPK